MKRLLESDDDQRVHDWSQYFENLVEGLNVAEYFSKGQTHDTYKTLSIKVLSEWTAPCNAPPYINDKYVVKMGFETYSMFIKFRTTFLMDLADNLVSKITRNDLTFKTSVTSDAQDSSTIFIVSKTKERFSRRKEEDIGEFIPQ
jgi:hypothetical protein